MEVWSYKYIYSPDGSKTNIRIHGNGFWSICNDLKKDGQRRRRRRKEKIYIYSFSLIIIWEEDPQSGK